MPPKRPPADAMTLHELGVSDPDCGFDPDGFLDGPPADGDDGVSSLEATKVIDPIADGDGWLPSATA